MTDEASKTRPSFARSPADPNVPLGGSRVSVLLAAAASLVSLLGLLLIAYVGQARLVSASQQLQAVKARQVTRAEVLLRVWDAEDAQRAYIATGRPSYLRQYASASAAAETALNQLLASYASNDSAALARLRQARLAMGGKLGAMRTSMELYASGGIDRSRALVPTDVAHESLKRMRTNLDALGAADQTRAASLAAAWERERANGRLLAIVGTAVNVALLILAVLLMLRILAHQKSLHQALLAQATDLRLAVDARTAELSELSTHLQNVAESEKAALARELHDELGGTLTGAKMDISWLRRQLPSQSAEHAARWQRLESALESSMNFKRRIVEQLRPTLLDNLGFHAAARWLVEETCAAAGLAHHIDLEEPEPTLAKDTAIALFRVLQESLTNVIKHARASEVWVSMDTDTERVRLIIRDNGSGIDVARKATARSHGMQSMRHRMHAVGGRVEVATVPAGGTEVVVTGRVARAEPPAAGLVSS